MCLHPFARKFAEMQLLIHRLPESAAGLPAEPVVFLSLLKHVPSAAFWPDHGERCKAPVSSLRIIGGCSAYISPNAEADSRAFPLRGAIIGGCSGGCLQNMPGQGAFCASGFTVPAGRGDDIPVQPMDVAEFAALSELSDQVVTDLAAWKTEDTAARALTLLAGRRMDLLLGLQLLDIFGWRTVTMPERNVLFGSGSMGSICVPKAPVMVFSVMLVLPPAVQTHPECAAIMGPRTGGRNSVRLRTLAEPPARKEDREVFRIAARNGRCSGTTSLPRDSTKERERLCQIYCAAEDNVRGANAHAAPDLAGCFEPHENEGEKKVRGGSGRLAAESRPVSPVLPAPVRQGGSAAHGPRVDTMAFPGRSVPVRNSKGGRNHATLFFRDGESVKQQEECVRMIGMIEAGIRNHEFTVYLQPKISPTDRRVAGAEALVRWIHPERGMIGPNIFIPLCEQNGLIGALDAYVFEEACRQIAQWEKKGWDPGVISVNVSRLQLKDAGFVRRYRAIADKYGVDPAKMELELTESVMLAAAELAQTRGVLDAIRASGFRCSMDDFGAGYSALGLLKELPVDGIKLDRSFFADCTGNRRAQIVIETMICLAKRLGISTVAEGLETSQQVALLRSMGCDMIQGFYFSPPLPVHEYEDMVFIRGEIYSEKGTSRRGKQGKSA